jgi:hypothetical protein
MKAFTRIGIAVLVAGLSAASGTQTKAQQPPPQSPNMTLLNKVALAPAPARHAAATPLRRRRA